MEKICGCHSIPNVWCSYSSLEKPLAREPEKFVEFYTTNHGNKITNVEQDDFLGKSPKKDGYIRFVVISDTHNRPTIETEIPDGDVLLHCGDFTMRSFNAEFTSFNEWIGTLPHPKKIVIAGNHDRFLEVRPLNTFFAAIGVSEKQELLDVLTNVTYIEDETVNICGYNIYGSPWTPVHLGGFQKQRGPSIKSKWEMIPSTTDILITHGPPVGVGDYTRQGYYAGCVDLLQEIQTRVKPLYSCFGHIHEGNGVYTDGTTTYINAAMCDTHYKARQLAYVFDLPEKGNIQLEPTASQGADSGEQGTPLEPTEALEHKYIH